MSGFRGFPVEALDFYDDLEMDNTKSFWTAHKDVYDTAVKAPMTALVAALEPEFGRAKVFRPYRDVRFAKDKTPFKTHQGAVGVIIFQERNQRRCHRDELLGADVHQGDLVARRHQEVASAA